MAIQQDFTVLTILNSSGQLVKWHRINGTSWEKIITEVASIINEWNAKIWVEKNSIGSVVEERLRQLCGSKITPFTTTNQSKNDIIENLKLQITDQNISLPVESVWPELHRELATFTFKTLPSGKLTYSAPSGLTDDIIMSLAMATKNWVENTSRPKFAFAK